MSNLFTTDITLSLKIKVDKNAMVSGNAKISNFVNYQFRKEANSRM